MATNKSYFSEFARIILQRQEIRSEALSGTLSSFTKCNTLSIQEFLPILDNSPFARIEFDIEFILSDTFNYFPEEIYVHYLKEKDIFENDGPNGRNMLMKWVTVANPTWITFCLTSPRFTHV